MKYWLLAGLTLLSTLLIGTFASDALSSEIFVAQSAGFSQGVVFTNADWQEVPNADVGQHSAETLMNMNSILREGDSVTFDVTGHRGVYYRMTGQCQTNQVARIRQGLSQGNNRFAYQEIAPNPSAALDWDQRLLSFACQNSEDCQETISELDRLSRSLDALDRAKAGYADLEAKLTLENYDLDRVIGSLETTERELARLDRQLLEVYENAPYAVRQAYQQESQRIQNLTTDSFDYAALRSEICNAMPDTPGLDSVYEMLQFRLPERRVQVGITILRGLHRVTSAVCFLDETARMADVVNQLFYQEHQARVNAIKRELSNQLETLIFAESSLRSIDQERQAASDEIYRIINRELYNNTDEHIAAMIDANQTPSPEAMVSMLQELNTWQQEIQEQVDNLMQSACVQQLMYSN